MQDAQKDAVKDGCIFLIVWSQEEMDLFISTYGKEIDDIFGTCEDFDDDFILPNDFIQVQQTVTRISKKKEAMNEISKIKGELLKAQFDADEDNLEKVLSYAENCMADIFEYEEYVDDGFDIGLFQEEIRTSVSEYQNLQPRNRFVETRRWHRVQTHPTSRRWTP